MAVDKRYQTEAPPTPLQAAQRTQTRLNVAIIQASRREGLRDAL